jgi:hypothetical protein
MKSDTIHDHSAKLESLEQRIGFIEKFVEARKLIKSDPKRMVSLCDQLLAEETVEVIFFHGCGTPRR